jgi:hypothetical protein
LRRNQRDFGRQFNYKDTQRISMSGEKPITGKAKHTDLTIDQIAAMQPGMSRLMEEISHRFWITFYAAQGGNWDLAAHELKQAKKMFKLCSTMRPQMAEMLNGYVEECFTPLEQLIAAKDFQSFERAYHRAVERANEFHVLTGYTQIKWRLPTAPPQHLDLTPQPSRPPKKEK